MAISEYIDPEFQKEKLAELTDIRAKTDNLTFSGDELKVTISGGTVEVDNVNIAGGTLDQVTSIANDVNVTATDLDIRDLTSSDTPGRSWNLSSSDVIGEIQDITGGTIDQVTDILNAVTVTATDLDIRDLGASDTPGRSWTLGSSDSIGAIEDIQGGTIDQVTAIANALPTGANTIGHVRALDDADTGIGGISQDIAGATENAWSVVPSGSPGDYTRQPVHDNVTASDTQSSISYGTSQKTIKAKAKGNDIYLRVNNSSGGTIIVAQNSGRVFGYSAVDTLYYKTPTATTGTLDVEAWS